MKNLNLIKRLWTDSHEKQTPQRLKRYAAILIMLLTLGVGQMWADNFPAGSILFLNAGDYWKQDNAWFAIYFYGGDGEKWVRMTRIGSTDYYYAEVPSGSRPNCIFCRMDKNKDALEWKSRWNQSGDLTYQSGKNFWQKGASNNDWSAGTWGTYKPTSTASLSGTSSITTAETSTLTPSITNTEYNVIKTTSYSVTTNPGSAGSVTSAGVFSATAAGSYTVTATVTYNPKGYSSLTSTATATKNITVTAASTATLTYHANWYTTGTSGSVPAAQTVAVGASATVANRNTLAMTNYTFSGWNTSPYSTGTSYAVGSSITMDEDKDLYAVWKRSIPMDDQDATTGVSATVYGTYNCTTLSAYDNPEKDGYTFGGWYTAVAGGDSYVISPEHVLQASMYHWTDAGGRFTRYPSSTSSLYAKWTQTVTLNANTANHGVSPNRSATATWNKTSITIPTHCSAATGYSLDGYYTAATGGTKIIESDKSFAGSDITVSGDPYISSGKWVHPGATTLYAQYTPIQYTISFNKQSGSNGTNSATVHFNNNDFSVSPVVAPTYTGYTFGGYYTSSGGAGVQIVNENGVWQSNQASYLDENGKWIYANNKTVYAKWTEKKVSISPTVNETGTAQGYTASADPSSIGIETTAVLTADAPGEGYRFSGWTLSENLVITSGTSSDRSITVRTNGDGNAVTATANYAVDTYIRLYFQNTGNWGTIDAYVWYDGHDKEEGGKNAAWPGVNINSQTETICGVTYHYYEFDRTAHPNWNKIIFNCGSDVCQTSNLDIAGHNRLFYKFSDSKWYVPTNTFYFVNTEFWDNVYVYCWKGSGDYGYGEWPGTAMEKVGTVMIDGHEYDYYGVAGGVCSYSDGNYIVNNGKGKTSPDKKQTSDLTSIYNYYGQYFVPDDCFGASSDPSDSDKPSGSWYDADGVHSATIGCPELLPFADINTINLSASKVPPMATITATPDMNNKRSVDQAYCWGVYTDAACTSKVNGISFSSLGDGKVQFTVPQSAGTYYLKLMVRASAACNASIDDEASVSFQVTTDNMVFFNNTSTQWSGVYVYFLGGTSYWDSNLGSGCKDRDGGQANQMNRIGKSDIYYFDYTGHATGLGSEDTVYVAFTEIGKPKAANFYYVNAAYRGDFSACAPMYVPDGGWITDYKNSCQYYNRGYWTTYGVSGQIRGAGFTLHVYDGVVTGSQIAGGEHILSNTDGSNTYKATVTLPSRNYTYGFKLESCGHIWYGNGGTMTAHNSTAWPQYTGTNNCGVSSMAAGKYTFIVQCADDGNLKVSVEYPLMDGDYRLIYNDTCSYQTGWHPSQFIRNSHGTSQLDTVAMYIRPRKQSVLKIQVCDDASANPPTWRDSATYDVSGLTDGNRVYNFYISQAAGKLTINSTSPYTGLYYVRAHGLGGGWTNYKTDKDNRMTYTEYAEEKNYGFNYYKAHWYGATGVNVTYTVACDYSESLCDTLVADAGNNPLTAAEARSLPHTASIRFGWDSKTNTLKRAYINGSSNVSDRYLVMKGVNSKIFTSDGEGVKNDNALNDYEYKFADLNNWIYQADVKARCGATALLTAKYDNHVQDFIGTSSPVEKGDTILSGSDDGSTKYAVRVIYDFKTNRLLCAWLADGTTITEDKAINADVMIVRQHHEDAAQISFSNSAKLTDVKTVYGVLQLKKDTMTNTSKPIYRRGLYWISFPFDVKLSEVFGLGEYGTHWMLEYYDGAARAREGFWAESDGFWKFVSVAQRKDFVMKANVGYVIGLDVDLLQDGGSDVWANNTQEASLYFPSASAVSTIDGTLPSGGTYTVPSHECSITRDDRNIKDSHWNIIGVPSYANVTGNNVVEEVTIGGNTLPFLYKHNMNDNSIEVVGADDDFTFRAMHAYYVQYAGTIDWTVRDPFPTSGLTARRNGNADKDVYSLKLTIRDEEETQSDRALIRLTDEASASFELSKDLAKAFNRGKVNLYTLIDGVEAAGNNLPLVAGGVTYIPVGVKTYGGGTYTISLPEGTDDLEVYLLDQATGARTNLAVSGYEVVLPNGVTDDRFMLEIGRNNAPTAVESVDAEGKKVVKFIENDMLYILKDGNIYDARGARVK